MTLLITGGAGFIGSRLAVRYLAAGQPVVILDNFNDYYDPAIKRANIAALTTLPNAPIMIEGDIRDEALVERIFSEHGISRVAHLAAMSGVRYSIDRAALYASVNTGGTVILLEAARRYNVSLFVMASTSSVYGDTTPAPFVEDAPADHPLAPYPASKRAAEMFGYSYHQLFGLNVTALRFFNVYGPHGRPDMMPIRTIESILKGETIQMYDGGDLKRDWTFIDDILDGVMAALERPLGFQIINLGFGSPIDLKEFIHIYEELIGKPALTRNVPAPASEPAILYCDNTRARKMLDFDPKVAIADGLAKTWAWYRAQYGV
jgi:UDP-glucuronate 4-epimerase